MKGTLRAVGRLSSLIAWTAAVAYVGAYLWPGFDIRGPFLLVSPFFATSLVSVWASLYFADSASTTASKKADVEAVKRVAEEFDLGEVAVWQATVGERLVVEIELIAEARRVQLPKNWQDLSADAKRFAIVRAVARQKESLYVRIAKGVPFYVICTSAMLVAGLNLWSIIPSHSLSVAAFLYSIYAGKARFYAKQDRFALSIMRDLKAAKAYVRADEMNKVMKIRPEVRIEALDRAAKRLGIA